MSKPKEEDLTIEYINKRIETLFKKFRRLEELCFKWKQEDAEDIDELKMFMKARQDAPEEDRE